MSQPNTTQPTAESQSNLPPKLGAPAERALAAAGYMWLEQFTQVSEADLLKLHGVGPNAVGKIRSALAARGLSFAEGENRDHEQSKSLGEKYEHPG